MSGFLSDRDYDFRPGTWVYEVPKDSMPKGAAWLRCTRAGRKLGIWVWTWRKAHTHTHWRYYTLVGKALREQAEYLREIGVLKRT